MSIRNDPPNGEWGHVRLPWNVLPRGAVRDQAGRVWIRAVDDGKWFDLTSPESVDSFTPDGGGAA